MEQTVISADSKLQTVLNGKVTEQQTYEVKIAYQNAIIAFRKAAWDKYKKISSFAEVSISDFQINALDEERKDLRTINLVRLLNCLPELETLESLYATYFPEIASTSGNIFGTMISQYENLANIIAEMKAMEKQAVTSKSEAIKRHAKRIEARNEAFQVEVQARKGAMQAIEVMAELNETEKTLDKQEKSAADYGKFLAQTTLDPDGTVKIVFDGLKVAKKLYAQFDNAGNLPNGVSEKAKALVSTWIGNVDLATGEVKGLTSSDLHFFGDTNLNNLVGKNSASTTFPLWHEYMALWLVQTPIYEDRKHGQSAKPVGVKDMWFVVSLGSNQQLVLTRMFDPKLAKQTAIENIKSRLNSKKV